MSNIIGIDIGGTNFRIGLADDEGVLQKFRKLPVKHVIHSENALEDIACFIESYADGEKIDIVSIGVPATLNRERTKILQTPNLRFMENLPVVDYLSRRLNARVCADRDVTMTLCYDLRKYDVPREGIVVGIYFGTGVGNAIMIDGHFLLGRNGTAGELGHIPLAGFEEVCGCGLTGCLEKAAGGQYLVSRYGVDGIADVFVKHGAELGEFIGRMAIGVAIEVNLLDPDYVILGGGLLNMLAFPRETLHAKILEHVRRPYPAENLRIIYADDEPEKGALGAVYYALDKMRNAV